MSVKERNELHAEPSSFVFVTGHSFGRRALEGILASDAAISRRLRCSMIIKLDEVKKSMTVGYSSIDDLAADYNVPLETTTDGALRSFEDHLLQIAPHYLLVIGWSRLIASSVLNIPARCWANDITKRNDQSYGCIGMHPTRLPEGRGQAPIPWTIIKGVTKSALSVFHLEDGADTGNIIAQYDIDIRPEETGGTLFLRFANLHYHAGADLAQLMASRTVKSVTQDESKASLWPKRRPSDGRISPLMPSADVDKVVRALSGPYPRAFIVVNNLNVRIVSTKIMLKDSKYKIGSVLANNKIDRLEIAWAESEVLELFIDPRDRGLMESISVNNCVEV